MFLIRRRITIPVGRCLVFLSFPMPGSKSFVGVVFFFSFSLLLLGFPSCPKCRIEEGRGGVVVGEQLLLLRKGGGAQKKKMRVSTGHLQEVNVSMYHSSVTGFLSPLVLSQDLQKWEGTSITTTCTKIKETLN